MEQGKFTILNLFDSLSWFKTGGDWTPWRAFLCALYGLPMTPEELECFRACTGRRSPPTEPATEVWLIAGRRAKKSAIAALLAVWRALFYNYAPPKGPLAPGERAKIPIIAKNKLEAKTIRSFALAILRTSNLRCFLQTQDPPEETIPLTNGIDLAIIACNIMAGRSYASVLALLDEVAFFRSEDSAHPDEDIARGVKAGMAMIPGAILGGLSSPWAKRGLLYQKYRDHFGKDDGILVWKAGTTYMNRDPLLAQVVDQAYKDDPIAAATEYGAEFRSDVDVFIPEEIIDAAMVRSNWLDPVEGVRYFAFCDPSGGAKDAFTLAIAHADYARQKVILDVLEAVQAPFRPSDAHEQLAKTLKRFGLRFVTGDKYAGEYPADGFRAHQIGYTPSELTRSQIYVEFLPLMMGGKTELIRDNKLRTELVALDRRTTSNREIIDHPPDGSDDRANCAAGALGLAAKIGLKIKPPEPDKPQGNPEEQRAREFQAYLKSLHNPEESKGSKWDYLNRGGR